ncbi:MAG: hypothetical protein CM1200mP10_19370 [Candidatus Neomarinimicrobiota bacterium]|nr:MAG: hypothetical protein CM1200mP10_19370 [Candidatus Neomarinimicrobiota bacterium]
MIEQTDWHLIYSKDPETKFLETELNMHKLSTAMICPVFSIGGFFPSMQATHCTSDMYWIDERLGEQRLHEAYPWQSLLQTGSIISGGSDAPVEIPNPLLGIHAAVTRQEQAVGLLEVGNQMNE